MEVRSLVGWNLRRLRVERGISQDDLALEAGVERAYVGHLERGTRNPTIVTLDKLAEALNSHVSELLKPAPEGSKPVQPLKPGRRRS
jgi:transcriptional regulator with XRE-family HTH domain